MSLRQDFASCLIHWHWIYKQQQRIFTKILIYTYLDETIVTEISIHVNAYVDFMSGSGVVADDFASLSDLRDTTKAFDRL